MDQCHELEGAIGHRFQDRGLLDRAMAHRSWVSEHPGSASNERLEFLGDAVLGWIVADLVFRRFGHLPEGALTDLRKSVVNAGALAEVANELGLGPHLLLGRGEDAAGGRDKPSILSDAFEAVLGAVYLDGGGDAAFEFVDRVIGPRLVDAPSILERVDHKSALQEEVARRGHEPPEYVVVGEGPDHAKRFTASVVVEGRQVGRGLGRSKKLAEQVAAAEALRAIRSDPASASASGPASVESACDAPDVAG